MFTLRKCVYNVVQKVDSDKELVQLEEDGVEVDSTLQFLIVHDEDKATKGRHRFVDHFAQSGWVNS